MRRLAVFLTVLALVATACGGSDDDDPVVVQTTTTAIFATTTMADVSGDSAAATTTTEAVYQATTTTVASATTTAPPATTTEAPPEVAESVTVEAGDSLSKIAKRHDTTVEDIMARNAIDDPNLLFVGQELVIDGEVPSADEPEVNPNC